MIVIVQDGKTNDEYNNFYDLVMHNVKHWVETHVPSAAHCMGMDVGVQKELSKIPKMDQSLQKFYEESYDAGSRAKH